MKKRRPPRERDTKGKFIGSKGMYVDDKGYWNYTMGPNKNRRVHRVLMEEFIGRPLRRDEVVHHRDGDKLNNGLHADGQWNLEILGEREHNAISAKQLWFLKRMRQKELAEWEDYFDVDATPQKVDDGLSSEKFSPLESVSGD